MILSRCTERGCGVLTIGLRCVEHDLPVSRVFPRGRPFPGPPSPIQAIAQPAVAAPPSGPRAGAVPLVGAS